MEYADSLWAHLGGEGEVDVTTESEVNTWLEKLLSEAEEDNLDESGVEGEPYVETTWNSAARTIARREAIMRRTATGEPAWIEAARRIVANKTFETVDGVLFDLFSASAVLGVYEALNDENKARFGEMSLPNAVNIAFKLMNRTSRRRAMRKRASEVPDDFPVKVLKPGTEAYNNAKDLATCGECGRSWDDAVITGWTPAPSARCPFEYFHDYDDDDDDGYTARRRVRRQAGAPTIMGPNPELKNAPKAEQDAYWTFVSQGAADSDSGWYVPLSFASWRYSYWDEEKGQPTYGTGMPPMASMRRRATEVKGDTEDTEELYDDWSHLDDGDSGFYSKSDETLAYEMAEQGREDDIDEGDSQAVYDDWAHSGQRTAADDDDELIDWQKRKKDEDEGLVDWGGVKPQKYQRELKTR